jgi:hypothetical protein
MRFRSAVDTWFYIVALVLPAAILIFVAANVGAAHTETMVIIGGSAVIALGLPVWLLLSTYYDIQAGVLTIRSGPFRWSVPISDITSVEASRSLLSSPALSLNRLEIQYGRGKTVLVSPKDIQGFRNAIGW